MSALREQSLTRLVWASDLGHVSEKLESLGAIPEVEPGFYAVDETIAPDELVDLYRKLCQVGYCNGWLS